MSLSKYCGLDQKGVRRRGKQRWEKKKKKSMQKRRYGELILEPVLDLSATRPAFLTLQ